MNILIINTKNDGGGAASVARQIAQGYEKAGHQVHWIVGLKSDRSGANVTEIPTPGDCGFLRSLGPDLIKTASSTLSNGLARQRWRRLLQSTDPRSQWAQFRGHEDFNLISLRRFLKLLPWEPDVVHLHNLHGFNYLTHFDLRILPYITQRWPTLVTMHDPWLATGHCAHFFECEGWLHACGQCPHLTTYPKLRRDGTTYNLQRKADIYRQSQLHVVGVCAWIAGVAGRSIMKPAIASSRVIPNGIDLNHFRPLSHEACLLRRVELQIPANAFVVTYASELGARNPYRDFQAMREACETVGQSIGDRPIVSIELGGDKSAPIILGNRRILSPGFVSADTLMSYLQISDVLLHAARADTSPTVIYEAMACGLPVVATSVCGIPEQVEHGLTGLLNANAATLAQPLLELALNPDRRNAMGRAARVRMETHFSRERMIEDYLAALPELTAANSALGLRR